MVFEANIASMLLYFDSDAKILFVLFSRVLPANVMYFQSERIETHRLQHDGEFDFDVTFFWDAVKPVYKNQNFKEPSG